VQADSRPMFDSLGMKSRSTVPECAICAALQLDETGVNGSSLTPKFADSGRTSVGGATTPSNSPHSTCYVTA
jgi:hypothetical protein